MAEKHLGFVADFDTSDSRDWPLVNATIAQTRATLALVEVIREALTPDPEDAPAPAVPDATEPQTFWSEVTPDTVWEPGDLARELPFADAPLFIVVAASTDSFGDTVLKARAVLDLHDDTPEDEIPVQTMHLDASDLPRWRRKAKADRA